MISSPVEMIATIGFRQTSTSATPTAASTPVSRLLSGCPRRSTVSPDVMSVPANEIPLPAVTALMMRSSPSRPSACSTMTTASAPRGTMPPVAICAATPEWMTEAGTTPVWMSSSTMRTVRGASSDAPNVSSATTAKPSTFDRSNDGTSTGETTSAARTRPSAAVSGTRSIPRGVRSSAARNRRSASSRSRTWRNCVWDIESTNSGKFKVQS